jgi:predicted O-linked N-acetylglucosamine transferase (SPINDLY family)
MINTDKGLLTPGNGQNQVLPYLSQGDYAKAAALYQQAIEAEPAVKHHYWYFGLMLLLQGQEAEAQTSWMLAMMEGSSEEIEQWTGELIAVLQSEAERQQALDNYPLAWTIRQHIREIQPDNLNNLLHLIHLSIELQKFTGEDLTSLGIIQLLKSEDKTSIDSSLLLQVLSKVLDYAPFNPSLLEFTEVCQPYAPNPQAFIHLLMLAATTMAYGANQPQPAIQLARLCWQLDTNKLEILSHLVTFYHDNGDYEESIKTAQLFCTRARTLPDQIFAHNLLLRELAIAGGRWQEVFALFEDYKSRLQSLITTQSIIGNRNSISHLVNSTFLLPYLGDAPKTNRLLQNQVLQLCQVSIEHYEQERIEKYRQRSSAKGKNDSQRKPLKIGYLSHCLGRHSVGWLARWIFEHHDHDRFEIHSYFVNYQFQVNDPLQDGFVEHSDRVNKFTRNALEIADKIYNDDIDILVDLDSITLDITCEVVALKPAPIQVTWLGWDASGIPTIDYFIADPYVLPESAQDYYKEKIWRLPQTYIAVDGFEVGVPTLRRDQLDIPNDAIVYLSTQKGYKRHPETVRWQMKILQQVPNSYFLIKGMADQESVKHFFTQMAQEEGVSCDRLRFLPEVALESVHRANLGIADVVLDTYPYNGATTTLETLWMGIPLVTRVGQQFAARNSYTMMINAGITEGIAETDEEYIEWGVRLGKDEALRQNIAWKLRQSRHTAPLWNAQQFTREMEKAYEQMWLKSLE